MARIFNWIRTTYPHANHTLVNGAVPATPSAYMALCWRYYVPRQPDLMIVEYNVNDGAERSTNAPIRRAHERLLRSLLSLPSSPAVIENVVMRIPDALSECRVHMLHTMAHNHVHGSMDPSLSIQGC